MDAVPPDFPALAAPAGTQSNFDDPPSLWFASLAVYTVTNVLMIVVVCIRLYTKVVLLRNVKHEDYVAIVALVGLLAWSSIFLYLAYKGITRHLWDVRAIDMPHLLYYANVFQVEYSFAMFAAKYSVLIQLYRPFSPPPIRDGVTWAIYGLIAATTGYYVSCFFTFLFQCVPREAIWNPLMGGARCIKTDEATLIAGVLNLALDLGILLVSLWVIWHLRISRQKKMRIYILFGVGFITCGVAAAGVAYRVPLLYDDDKTPWVGRVGIWTMAENLGTVLVGALPSFPAFYRHLRGESLPIRSSKRPLRETSYTPRKSRSKTSADGSNQSSEYVEPAPQVLSWPPE